jgi:hypothetical protein
VKRAGLDASPHSNQFVRLRREQIIREGGTGMKNTDLSQFARFGNVPGVGVDADQVVALVVRRGP